MNNDSAAKRELGTSAAKIIAPTVDIPVAKRQPRLGDVAFNHRAPDKVIIRVDAKVNSSTGTGPDTSKT
jgi:hypothetical protein